MQSKYTTPDLARSALLTIDVQRDFTLPGAPAEIAGTHDCLPRMQRIVAAYRQRALPIIHVVRLYQADGANVDICRREAIEQGKVVVRPGSSGAELVDPLKPQANLQLNSDTLLNGNLQQLAFNEWAIYKPRWDAFHETPLDRHLRALGVTTVVVIGCNFPNCPRTTLYGASMRDYRAALIADATSGVYEQGIRELNGIGIATPTTEEFLALLG